MNNYPWNHNRPFNAYSVFFKEYFGERVQKLSIDAGFTCPNRDGSKGVGGCTYCNNNAFNPSYCREHKDINTQINEGIEFHSIRYRKASKFLVYFQAYSNTYGDVDYLEKIYRKALENEKVIGLNIGTRPDCIDDKKIDLLKKLQDEGYFIQLELGIESCYDKSLEYINRGHNYKIAEETLIKARKGSIRTCAHFIWGLPGESIKMMMDTAPIISNLPLDSIKFHQLQIVKDTLMENDYKVNKNKYTIFSLDQYVDFICEYIQYFNPNILIERFAGEVPPRYLVAGGFGTLRYDQVLQKIEKELIARDTWQGKKF